MCKDSVVSCSENVGTSIGVVIHNNRLFYTISALPMKARHVYKQALGLCKNAARQDKFLYLLKWHAQGLLLRTCAGVGAEQEYQLRMYYVQERCRAAFEQ